MSNHPHLRPQGNQPVDVPVEVPPGPVPTQMVVRQVQVGGNPVVLVTVLTPVGQNHYFLPNDMARQVGQAMVKYATPVTLAN